MQCIANKLALLSTSCAGVGEWRFVEVRSTLYQEIGKTVFNGFVMMELLIKLKERLQIDQSQLDQIEVVDWHESKPN